MNYVIVTVNGRPGIYEYKKGGSRSQSLHYVADVQDLIDLWKLDQDDHIV